MAHMNTRHGRAEFSPLDSEGSASLLATPTTGFTIRRSARTERERRCWSLNLLDAHSTKSHGMTVDLDDDLAPARGRR